jgi:nitroreductase
MEHVFGAALRAPSNCNTQPWYVHIVTGDLLEDLRKTLPEKFAAGEVEFDYPYEGRYEGVFKERQYGAAKALYDALGIPREDKARRTEWFLDNFRFFGAPACAFFTLPANFGLREACDLGMYAQTVMLSLTAHGLGSCPQTSLGFMANVLRPALKLPEDQKLLFGLSFGYPAGESAVNGVRTDRAALGDAVFFHQ